MAATELQVSLNAACGLVATYRAPSDTTQMSPAALHLHLLHAYKSYVTAR